jgi:hypothetical protein
VAKLTFGDLLNDAKSRDPVVYRRALETYRTWVAMAPQLDARDRLTQMERSIIEQMFIARGINVR